MTAQRFATVCVVAVLLVVLGGLCVPLDHQDAGATHETFAHHDGRWARLAHCESTHRWKIEDGGLQIIPPTWRAFGGRRFPPAGPAPRRAERASRSQQKTVGRRIAWYGWRDTPPQGGGAWPYCWPRTR